MPRQTTVRSVASTNPEMLRYNGIAPANGELTDYRLAHAARADLCRRLGRSDEARVAYEKALSLTSPGPERHYLERRLAGLKK